MLDDPEMRDFITRLQHTPPGLRYRRAWNAMRTALKQIYRLEGLESVVCKAQRLAYQRMYHEASESASMALENLTMLHDWPNDSLADCSFTYQPPARALRPRRRSP
jgi:hypothetical protein